MVATTTMVHVRVDEKIKTEAAEALALMGLTISDAVRVFLTRVVVDQELPFSLKAPNDTSRVAIAEANAIIEARRARFADSHQLLDITKQKISCEVLARHSIIEIKKKSLSNIERWRSQGTFGQAYADWIEILVDPGESKLISAMVGNSERSNQLRQSMPYTGMLDQETVARIRDQAKAEMW